MDIRKGFKPEVRQGILERDNHQCQLSLLFGISELSGVPCSKNLEAHHITYKRAGNHKEKVKDGITVCKRCHEILTNAIREERYTQKNYTLKDVMQLLPKFKHKEKIYETVQLQDYGNNTPGNAQGGHG